MVAKWKEEYMKKIKTVGLLIILCLLMMGCSNEVKNEKTIESSNSEITQTDKSGELKLSLEYNPKTDSPRGYINGDMGESENGYFFVTTSGYHIGTKNQVSMFRCAVIPIVSIRQWTV